MNYQDTRLEHSGKTVPEHRLAPAQLRRGTVLTISAVVAVLAILWGFNSFRSHMMKQFFANNKPPPLAVSTEIVQPAAVPQALTGIGSVSAVHQVVMSPEIAGRVVKFSFLPGQPVKKGDLLVQINDAPEQADLAVARAQQRLAKVTLDRSRELATRGFAAKSQLDQAQSQFDAAAATIARDEAVIAQKQIRAPFDGVLGVRLVEAGQYVKTGDSLVTLTDLDSLFAEFTLPEQTRPQLRLGQDVDLSVDAYPGRTFTAKLLVIDPQVNPDTRTIKLQALIDNGDHQLMPGMFANVRVVLPPQEGVLTVPETALDHTIYGDSVYLVRGGEAGGDGKTSFTAVRTPVTAGAHAKGRVAVTGLKAGDRIATTGLVKLFDGAPVTLSDEPGPQPPAKLPLN